MRSGNRDMRRMLDRMGLDMKDLSSVEEVIIKTDTKEIFLKKPQVVEMKGKDSTIFQIVATEIEESNRSVTSFKDEDVILVMQQANVSKEKAINALTETKGDMAQAILNLTI
jgi:nascent polypeptide-associated complex subunit alpha